jgi:5-methylcytosine-specific restriction endonuclease McrA
MSSQVFVRDAQGRPLMPMSAAYARRLHQSGKAQFLALQPFPVMQLSIEVPQPQLRPIYLGITLHLHTAELYLLAIGRHHLIRVASILIDLRSDLNWRFRRRAGHRRRRRARQRYRKIRHQGLPYKMRRPSVARSKRSRSLRSQQSSTSPRQWSVPTIIRWRAEAIARTIASLQSLVPISDVVLMPSTGTHSGRLSEASDLFEQLVAVYGLRQPDGKRVPACMYCGTIRGRIEIEHRLPVSRGGTDRWDNLVLACSPCNTQKGTRTPEEAGMAWEIHPVATPKMLSRRQPYVRQTEWLLRRLLRREGRHVVSAADLDKQVWLGLQSCRDLIDNALPRFIAKPIGRPRKQVFTARNYPLSLQSHRSYVQRGYTVKRLIRVNDALVVTPTAGRNHIRVICHGEPVPEDALCVVRLGMLCEGRRAGKRVIGIVCAIHSTGRLTLQIPASAGREGISWNRVIISPRQHLHILSTERIIFFAAPAITLSESYLLEEEQ